MAGAYLVVRIKGQADVPHWARTTLTLLKLEKKYRATIIPATDTPRGMLQKVQTFVSWCDATPEIVTELVQKRARKTGYVPLTDDDIRSMGYGDADALAESLYTGQKALAKLKPLKPWFALAPPRLGFKRSTKRLAGQRGILGKNKDLPDIIRRMI